MRRVGFELRYLLRRTPWDTDVSPPELLAFIDANPAGRALDLGCGTGTNVMTLAQHGWAVTGVDFSARAIAAARRRAQAAGLSANLRLGDVTEIADIHGPFDLILDIGCFHRLDRTAQARYVKNLDSLLARRGAFLLYAFVSDSTTAAPFPSVDQTAAKFAPHLSPRGIQLGRDRLRAAAWFTFMRPD